MTTYCPRCCNKVLYRSRQEAERAREALRSKNGYTGEVYRCRNGGAGFHIGRDRKELIASKGTRNYRRFDKRRAYSEYQSQSESLHDALKKKSITQQEFDRAHELLDEKFNWVR
jgi:hypothetical protein